MDDEHHNNPLACVVRKAGIFYATLCSGATIIMMFVGTADVVGSKFLNIPVPGTYELTATLMAALCFGGLSLAQTQGRHVRVEIFFSRYPWKLRCFSDSLGLMVGIIFFGFLTWRTSIYFWQSWQVKEFQPGLIKFPIYPAKFLIMIGVFLMLLQLLVDFIYSLKKFNIPEIKTSD